MSSSLALRTHCSALSSSAPSRQARHRALVATRVARGAGPLFQLEGSRHLDLDLADVRDAVEVCSVARTPGEKAECYSVFGLDHEKVERYYEPVMKWEEAIDQGDSTAKRMVAFGTVAFALMLTSKARGVF